MLQCSNFRPHSLTELLKSGELEMLKILNEMLMNGTLNE